MPRCKWKCRTVCSDCALRSSAITLQVRGSAWTGTRNFSSLGRQRGGWEAKPPARSASRFQVLAASLLQREDHPTQDIRCSSFFVSKGCVVCPPPKHHNGFKLCQSQRSSSLFVRHPLPPLPHFSADLPHTRALRCIVWYLYTLRPSASGPCGPYLNI